MSRSIQLGSSIGRLGYYIRRTFRHKRIEDVVGMRILADEDWKRTRAELKKVSKDTLSRLEHPY
ncbi:Uncharacterised protein [uncultured archaeon]|nr:Uncharacterised protein [uncultured archaeon]